MVSTTMLLAAIVAVLATAANARPLASRALLQTLPIAPNTTGVTTGGFTYGSEVGAYTLIPQDVCDIATALSANPPDFNTAVTIYEEGKNAPGRTTLRFLKGFATGAVYANPLQYRLAFIEYYNELYFINAAVDEALELTPTAISAQVARWAIQGLELTHYMMHEVEAGLNKTLSGAANNTSPITGAPHNLDEGWGLYAGVSGGCGSLLNVVTSMSKAFGAQKDSADGTKCESLTHNAILAAFQKMQAAALAGDAVEFTKGRDALASHITVPFLQGTLRAAFDISKRVALKQNAKLQQAQGYGYWRTIEPVVAAVDQAAADAVAEAFFLDEAPLANSYAMVSAALKPVYAKMGIAPAVVGSLGAKQYLKCDGTKQALDKCLAKCPKTNKLVCGANGATYRTRCHALCYNTSVRKLGKC